MEEVLNSGLLLIYAYSRQFRTFYFLGTISLHQDAARKASNKICRHNNSDPNLWMLPYNAGISMATVGVPSLQIKIFQSCWWISWIAANSHNYRTLLNELVMAECEMT